MIFSFLRTGIKRLLVRYFNQIPIPTSLSKLDYEPESLIIVAQSRTVIIEALMESFFMRKAKQPISYFSPGSPGPTYISVHDFAGLEQAHKQGLTASTLNIFRGRGAAYSQPSYKIKFLDYVALLFGTPLGSTVLVIVFGKATPLQSFETDIGRRLSRYLKYDYYRNLKMVRGTPFQSFRSQKATILSGVDYERELKSIADRLEISTATAHRQAEKALTKIAARPSAPVYIPAAIIARFILKRLFTEIEVRGLESLSENVRNHTVVLVPMHRSHLDYILLSSILYQSDLNPPLIAAGINLNFWPVGRILKALGAYFVRRNAAEDRIYSLILKRYVSYLSKRGNLQEFFIEGGRSRSGRMLSPKMGLLSVIVSTHLRGNKEDILFVPVSLSYEHVIEDKDFGKENTGAEKTKENLASLIRARSVFRYNYQEVIVDFGRAISLKNFVQEKNLTKNRGEVVPQLAQELVLNVQTQTVLSLRACVATALLNSSGYGLTRQELDNKIATLVELAKIFFESQDKDLESHISPSLRKFMRYGSQSSSEVFLTGIFKKERCANQDVIFVPGTSRFTADFYKNTTLHIFLMFGIISLLSTRQKEINWENTRPYYDLLRNDFQLPDVTQFEKDFSSFCNGLRSAGLLDALEPMLTSRGEEILQPRMLLAPLQSQLWVLLKLLSAQEESGNEQVVLVYKEFIQELHDEFRVAKYLDYLDRTEASSLSSLLYSLETFRSREMLEFRERNGKPYEIVIKDLNHPSVELIKQSVLSVRQWELKQVDRDVEFLNSQRS